MSWNYRIIDFGEHKALHEVYYDESGKYYAYTSMPVYFAFYPDETAEEMRKEVEMALSAFEKPVIKASEFEETVQ